MNKQTNMSGSSGIIIEALQFKVEIFIWFDRITFAANMDDHQQKFYNRHSRLQTFEMF